MFQKLFVLSTIGIVSIASTHAQTFKPSIAIGQTSSLVESKGLLPAQMEESFRKRNIMIQIGADYALKNNWYIFSGLRYNAYKIDYNYSPEIINNPNSVINLRTTYTTSRTFESFQMPIHVGKSFSMPCGIKANIFTGVSLGVLTRGKQYGSSGYSYGSYGSSDTIAHSIKVKEQSNFGSTTFNPLLEFGAAITPCGKLPQLKLGVINSYQILPSSEVKNNVVIENLITNQSHHYESNRNYKFHNVQLMLQYQFGSNKKKNRVLTDTPAN